MDRRQYLLLVVLTVLAGLVGGAMSNWIFMARIAAAQETKQHERVITAGQFQLFDEYGRMRFVIGMSEGQPVLGFKDDSGKDRIFLGLSSIIGDAWPLLRFRDKDENMRISISGGKGEPRITIHDEDGDPRAVLGCSDLKTSGNGPIERRSESSLVLFDRVGKVIWSAP